MNDLINRQDAIDMFEPWLKVTGYSEGEINMLRAVIYELQNIPSAEPEHKKGEWVDFTMVDKAATQELCGVCGTWSLGMAKNYCPNCGAYMQARGEQDDN